MVEYYKFLKSLTFVNTDVNANSSVKTACTFIQVRNTVSNQSVHCLPFRQKEVKGSFSDFLENIALDKMLFFIPKGLIFF